MDSLSGLLETLPRPTKLPEFRNLDRLRALLHEYTSDSDAGAPATSRSLVQRTVQPTEGLSISKTIAAVNQPSDRLVQADPSEARPLQYVPDTFPRPSVEEIAREIEETRVALERLTRGSGSTTGFGTCKTAILEYNPSTANPSGQEMARTVMITEKPRDPLSPPRYKHKRAPAPPGSPPPPLLHSPPRRTTATQYEAWRIPPCVSSWKNPKGYTVPLDKRLASDGRHLMEHAVNERFAGLTESLYVAEQEAREELQMRAEYEQRQESVRGREREAEMERLLDSNGAVRLNPSYSNQRKPTAADEHHFDPRLFNQSEGITSGLADDEAYNLYDRSMNTAARNILLTAPTALVTGSAFMADEAGEASSGGAGGSNRKEAQFAKLANKDYSTPLSFDQSVTDNTTYNQQPQPQNTDNDPFGLDAFLSAAKKQVR